MHEVTLRDFTFFQDVSAVALPFKKKLTKLHHLGRATSEYGEQQLLVLLMRGGLAANGLRFNFRQ